MVLQAAEEEICTLCRLLCHFNIPWIHRNVQALASSETILLVVISAQNDPSNIPITIQLTKSTWIRHVQPNTLHLGHSVLHNSTKPTLESPQARHKRRNRIAGSAGTRGRSRDRTT